MTLALLTLTSPLALGGLVLLAAPVIAHLLHRHARRTIKFPSIALLAEVVANQSQLSRLRRLLLLLLRALAVACIVLAFTRPVWLQSGEAASLDDAHAVVLLVDVSASTGQQTDGVSAMERIRADAQRTLDALRPGQDLANVVIADAAPHAVVPRLTLNLPALSREVAEVSVTEERADLPAAVALAGRFLSDHDGPTRLVILSDLQKTNWSEALPSLRDVLRPETQVTVAGSAPQTVPNVALGRTQHFPTQPIGGQKCNASVQVRNLSGGTQLAAVSAEFAAPDGGTTSQRQTVTLSPGEQRDVTFETTVPERGLLEVTFSIPNDALAADSRAYLTIEGAARLPIVVLGDDDPNVPGTAAYFLTRALAPRDDGSDVYQVRYLRPADLPEAPIAGVAAMFIGYLGELSPDAAKSIVDYVDQGGGVVFFCGDGPVARNLQTLQSQAGEHSLLPWSAGSRRDVRQEPLRISSSEWQSRWFREFDEQSRLAVAKIQFYRVWSAGAVDPAAEIPLAFSDGTPALGSRIYGQGQFLLAGFTPDATSTDLARHGAFVAWMQILARSLRPESAPIQAHPPGVAYEFADRFDDENAELTVIGPDGNPAPARVAQFPDGISIAMPRPTQTGIYRVRDGDSTLAAVAINLDPRESDLAPMDGELLEQLVGEGGIERQNVAAAGWSPDWKPDGRPLWGVCLAIALCALGLEQFLLGLWKR